MRTFTRRIGERQLFRVIELDNGFLTVTSGEVGTEGTRHSRPFADLDRAEAEHDLLIRQTLAEGYREETSAPDPPSPLQEALEAAIVADPDDLSAHMAYADFLSEQPDLASVARGEFIRAQLALDDPSIPMGEQARLLAREYKPLDVHLRQWLGELAPFLLDSLDERYRYRFARGWLDSIEAHRFTCAFAKTLAEAPEARMLRHLMLVSPVHERPQPDLLPPTCPPDCDFPAPFWLVGSPNLTNVRVLTLGSEESAGATTDGRSAEALVRTFPRLERLYLSANNVNMEGLFRLPLSSLRELHIACPGRWSLDSLPENPSLGRLEDLVIDARQVAFTRGASPTTLALVRRLARSPHLKSLHRLTLRRLYLGDEGVQEIINSGLLERLTYLSLRSVLMTPDGVHDLAACPDITHLEHLNLSSNVLTSAGLHALKATGVRLSTSDLSTDDDTMYTGME
jgi:uncharacterized protein (TIGR02996 family)